jgi:hypothetical protein
MRWTGKSSYFIWKKDPDELKDLAGLPEYGVYG